MLSVFELCVAVQQVFFCLFVCFQQISPGPSVQSSAGAPQLAHWIIQEVIRGHGDPSVLMVIGSQLLLPRRKWQSFHGCGSAWAGLRESSVTLERRGKGGHGYPGLRADWWVIAVKLYHQGLPFINVRMSGLPTEPLVSGPDSVVMGHLILQHILQNVHP